MSVNWRYRWAPSLGKLEGTAEQVWGIKKYNPKIDQDCSVVFFGLYGLPDFYELWRHKGPKYILWCGTDIIHFDHGYWLDDKGEIRLLTGPLAEWINANCESWTENEVEAEELRGWGIKCKVCPSFLGDVNAFELSFQRSDKPKVYASVSGDNFKQYGWDLIPDLAQKNLDIEFHLYGNNKPYEPVINLKNVFVHGRVPKKQMNDEIKQMQGGIRPLKFDGFSEILGKSILWGQWPISMIKYPHILSIDELSTLKDKKEPNYDGREFYRSILNNYPWNQKQS
jgi:hypothetical protein